MSKSNIENGVGSKAVKERFVKSCNTEDIRNYEFAQEIYAALSDNRWCLRDNINHVVNWKRREAARAVAASRGFNELYSDFVPSQAHGGVPEGLITQRAKEYLNDIGYELVKKGRRR